MKVTVRNWSKWQSYRKDRGTPPWIKIHRQIMSNPDWATLSDSEKGQLVSIWIVAADKNGEIPTDPRILRKVCQLDETPDINKFIRLGFLESDGCQDDAIVTSSGCQDDAPEKRRGEERREEEEEITTTQVSPKEVIQAQASESEPSTAVSSSKMSVNEFRFLFQQATGDFLPGGLNNEASQLCRRYPRDKLEDAFRITAVQGGKTLKYLKQVLVGKPREGNGKQPKTFDQLKMERLKQSMVEFAGGADDGTGQKTVCFADG